MQQPRVLQRLLRAGALLRVDGQQVRQEVEAAGVGLGDARRAGCCAWAAGIRTGTARAPQGMSQRGARPRMQP